MGEQREFRQQRRPSRLFNLREKYDVQDDLMDGPFERHYETLVAKTLLNIPDKEAHDKILAVKQREGLCQGLLFGILVDKERAGKYFEFLTVLSSGDQWYSTLCNVNMLLIEGFYKLRESCRDQFLYFFKLAIKIKVPKIDNVLLNLVRYLNDGLEYDMRLKMAERIASMLSDDVGKEWIMSLKPMASLLPVMLLIFIRYVADMKPMERARSPIANVCVFLIRRRFGDVSILGRDLVLALTKVSRVSQFVPIWKDILLAPQQLAPNFGGITELMLRPCPMNLHMLRVTTLVQKRLEFLLKTVKVGSHERHLEWFINAHLQGMDAASLRTELIRVILNYESYPEMRATIIQGLLASAAVGAELQWFKLVFWWDMLCFNGESPIAIDAILCTLRALLSQNPPFANSLLEFAAKESLLLHPGSAPTIKKSFNNALCMVASFPGGAVNISSVLEHPRVDRAVKDLLRDVAPNHLRRPAQPAPAVPVTALVPGPSTTTNNNGVTEKKPKRGRKISEKSEKTTTNNNQASVSSADKKKKKDDSKDNPLIGQLKDDMKAPMLELERLVREKAEDGEKCDVVERILLIMFENDDLQDEEDVEVVAGCFQQLFAAALSNNTHLPDDVSEESISRSFTSPIFAVFRNLNMTGESSRDVMISLISAMREKNKVIGYLLLYFIKESTADEIPLSIYEDIAKHRDETLESQLEEDLEHCAIDDHRLFARLLPYTFKQLPAAASSPGVLRVLTSYIDPQQLNDFVGYLIREDVSIFRRDTFMSVLNASLDWDAIPQMLFWQLVSIEGISVDWMYPLFLRVDSRKNHEAATQMLMMLKRIEPNSTLLRSILSRPIKSDDPFTVNAIKVLIEDAESCSRMGDMLGNIIRKQMANGEILVSSVNKQTKKNVVKLSMEHVFYHLNELANVCIMKEKRMTENLLTTHQFREAFLATKKNEKSCILYQKYDRLYTAVDVLYEETKSSSRSLRGNRPARGQKRADSPPPREDPSQPQHKKKKMLDPSLVESDSD